MKFKKRILPLGFYDLKSNQAHKNYLLTHQAIDNFLRQGYELYKTSLIEFADNFDKNFTTNSFNFLDPLTQKNVFIRQDITTQISQIVASNYHNFSDIKKICYYGDVINLKSEDLYSERQKTQVGCEIIGSNSVTDCFTVIKDTLCGLSSIKGLSITLSLPDFYNEIIENTKIAHNEKIFTAITQKQISTISSITPKYSEIINEIILHNNFEKLNSKIRQFFPTPKINKMMNDAEELVNLLKTNFTDLIINFDAFGDTNFNYHNKIVFDIFAQNSRYAIAKGGCYNIKSENANIPAVGSTIYINFLLKI